MYVAWWMRGMEAGDSGGAIAHVKRHPKGLGESVPLLGARTD